MTTELRPRFQRDLAAILDREAAERLFDRPTRSVSEYGVGILSDTDRMARGLEDERRALGMLPLSEIAHTDQREIDGEAIPTGRYLFGGGLYYGGRDRIRRPHPEGDPATAQQTFNIIGTWALGTLLLLAFVVLMVMGRLPWQ